MPSPRPVKAQLLGRRRFDVRRPYGSPDLLAINTRICGMCGNILGLGDNRYVDVAKGSAFRTDATPRFAQQLRLCPLL